MASRRVDADSHARNGAGRRTRRWNVAAEVLELHESVGVTWGRRLRRAGRRVLSHGDEAGMSADLHQLLPGFMFWVLLPLWLLAGIADYILHRRTEIESTSGRGESWLHVLQAAEVGVAIVAGLFLEISSLVLAILIACVLAHTL